MPHHIAFELLPCRHVGLRFAPLFCSTLLLSLTQPWPTRSRTFGVFPGSDICGQCSAGVLLYACKRFSRENSREEDRWVMAMCIFRQCQTVSRVFLPIYTPISRGGGFQFPPRLTSADTVVFRVVDRLGRGGWSYYLICMFRKTEHFSCICWPRVSSL